MSYLGSWKIDDLLTFPAITTRVDTGAATDADSAPSYRVYEDETSTPILTGSMALLDSANTAGFYTEQITLSAANGFEKGKCYTIYIQATVNSVIGATIRTFQIEAEVDSNSVSNIGTGVITAAAIADNAIDSGAIADGAITAAKIADGAIDAATFAAGAITATVIATGAVDADALAADAVTEIWAGSTAPTAGAIADAVWDEATAGHTTGGTFGEQLKTDVDAILEDTGTTLQAEVDGIQADTEDIQSRLPAALSGDGFIKADLLSIGDELVSGNNATLNLKKLNIVNGTGDALVAQATGGYGAMVTGDSGGLLVSGGTYSVDIDGSSAGGTGIKISGGGGNAAVSILGDTGTGLDVSGAVGMSVTGSTDHSVYIASFGAGFDGLHVEGGGGVGVSINAPQGIIGSDAEDLSVTNITDAVWEEMIADHSGTVGSTAEALDDAGSAGDPWNTAIPGSYGAGTAGKIVGDNLNATVSSRSSHSAADVWAVGTRTLTSFGTLIADIWANTSRTLTAISDSAGVTTLLSRLTSTRALNLDNLDIEISQIPTASENAAEILSAAGSSPIASNIKEVNDTAITGTGTVGSDPWRKA